MQDRSVNSANSATESSTSEKEFTSISTEPCKKPLFSTEPFSYVKIREKEEDYEEECEDLPMDVKKTMECAKRAYRPELCRSGFRTRNWAGLDFEDIFCALDQHNIAYKGIDCIDEITLQDFWTEHEDKSRPALISGLQTKWKAKEWTASNLRKRFGNEGVSIGTPKDRDRPVLIPLKHFLSYSEKTTDDSPMYCFDAGFGKRDKLQALLNDYDVPKLFLRNYFRLIPEADRPDYRWLLIGGRHSGTGVHQDALSTSAWNSLLHGRKLWLLFPPDTPKSLVKDFESCNLPVEYQSDAIAYFEMVLPQIGQESPWTPTVFIQTAGQTVFLPSRWWHCVLNLASFNVAITGNYCSKSDLPTAWPELCRKRLDLAPGFYEQLLKLDRPDDLMQLCPACFLRPYLDKGIQDRNKADKKFALADQQQSQAKRKNEANSGTGKKQK